MNYSSGTHPHIRAQETLRGMTWATALALVPAAAARLFFSRQALPLASLLLAACIYEEFAFLWFRRSRHSKKYKNFLDGSLFLKVLLFFLILSPAVPPLAAAAGLIAALFFASEIFGGLGAYPLHPVFAGFLFLRLAFQNSGFWNAPHGGPAGAALLALGGLYLAARKIIRPQVSLVFLLTAWLSAWILKMHVSMDGLELWLLTAFFAATEPATTPLSLSGHSIFAACAGALTAILESLGMDPAASCALAVLTCNLLTPWLDRRTRP